jgi:hypothetical protein
LNIWLLGVEVNASERKTGEFLMNTDPVSGDKSVELQAEIDRLSEKLGFVLRLSGSGQTMA